MSLITLRACAHCSCFGFDKTEYFCQNCWLKLGRQFLDKKQLLQEGYEFPTYSLFLWKEQKILGSMLKAQKGGGLPRLTEKLVESFLLKRTELNETKKHEKTRVYVPAPPQKKGAKDHAYCLARHFADKTTGYVWSGLERMTTTEQKQKKKVERNHLKLRAIQPLDELKGRRIIFVDDVITTGSTAKAGFEALEHPVSFEVWTLCCRPKIKLI